MPKRVRLLQNIRTFPGPARRTQLMRRNRSSLSNRQLVSPLTRLPLRQARPVQMTRGILL